MYILMCLREEQMEFEDGHFSGNKDDIGNLNTGCHLSVQRMYECVNKDDLIKVQ